MSGNDKYYIPKTIKSNKMFGIEREEFLIICSLFFFSLFIESWEFIVVSLILIWRYFVYSRKRKNFIPIFKYTKLYDFIGIKALPKPFVKKIF